MNIDMDRLGRLCRTKTTIGNIDTPIVDTLLVARNYQRVALRILDSHFFTNILIGVEIGGTIYTLKRTSDDDKSLFVSFLSHGEMPTFAYYVRPNGVESNFTATEWFLPEYVIQAGIEQFMGELVRP